MSSRPIVISRGKSFGRTSNTVRRPSGSRLVVTTPAGLWNRKSLVRSIGGISTPSSSIVSEGLTLKAGEVSLTPLTLILPSAISASASRRDAIPARASRLAMRSFEPAPSSSEGGREVKGRLRSDDPAEEGPVSRRGGRAVRSGRSWRTAGAASLVVRPERWSGRLWNGLSPSVRGRFWKAEPPPPLSRSRSTKGFAPPGLNPLLAGLPSADLNSRAGRSPPSLRSAGKRLRSVGAEAAGLAAAGRLEVALRPLAATCIVGLFCEWLLGAKSARLSRTGFATIAFDERARPCRPRAGPVVSLVVVVGHVAFALPRG